LILSSAGIAKKHAELLAQKFARGKRLFYINHRQVNLSNSAQVLNTLVNEFHNRNIAISKQRIIVETRRMSRWMIIIGESEKYYSVTKTNRDLNVYEGLLNSGYFELLRQLVVLFPKIELSLNNPTENMDFPTVQSRLKFQLAMWLGDYSTELELIQVANALLPVIEEIEDTKSWKMYQHFLQTLIAEFKLRVGE
jgi:hypothetical protein